MPIILQSEGTRAYHDGDYATVLSKLSAAIEEFPKKYEIYLQCSFVYRLLSKSQESLADADKAIQINPGSWEGWARKNLALRDLGCHSAASDAHKRALELLDQGSSSPSSFTYLWPISGYGIKPPPCPKMLLEEWHLEFPSEIPPCSYGIVCPKQKWKVFDRKGRELKYSIYPIWRKPWTVYMVLVLHGLAGDDRLVTCVSHSDQQTFLLVWDGVQHGFETEISAVQISERPNEESSFHPGLFRDAPINPRPSRNRQYFTTFTQTLPSSRSNSPAPDKCPHNEDEGPNALVPIDESRDALQDSQPEGTIRQIPDFTASAEAPDLRSGGDDSNAINTSIPTNEPRDAPENTQPREAIRKIPDPTAPTEAPLSTRIDMPPPELSRRNESNGPNTVNTPRLNESLSSSSESESESSETDSGDESPPSKRIKTETESPGPSSTPAREPEVIFKFIFEQSDMTCLILMAECSDSKILFTEARKFFKVFNKDVEVCMLSCRLPSQQEQRCLFEGSNGQFELLVNDIRALRNMGEKRLTLEVKCVT